MADKTWTNRIVGHDLVDPEQLLAHPLNARIHGKLQQDATAGNLDDIGWIKSVVVNTATGHVIDGHLRVMLAMRRGESVPVEYVELSEAEEHQALATLDPLANLATYDKELLDGLLHKVDTGDEALQEMLAGLAETAGLYPDKKPVQDPGPQIDKAEELRQKWDTAEGQIWRIGEHVVICGDCRQPDTWQRLLNAAEVDKVNGVFTSPPYAEQRKAQYGGVPTDEYIDWWEALQANVRGNLAGDGSFFVNIKPHCEDGQRVLYVMDMVCAMVRRWGWMLKDELYWDKMRPSPHDIKDVRRFYDAIESVYHFCGQIKIKFTPDNVMVEKNAEGKDRAIYENRRRRQRERSGDTSPIYSVTGSGYHDSTTTLNEGMRYPDNVICVAPYDGNQHAAAFPVALPDFFIRAYSDPGDVWLDPFLGSGTTIVAAHQNKRRGLGMEMLPKYVAVILERLRTVTNSQPSPVEA